MNSRSEFEPGNEQKKIRANPWSMVVMIGNLPQDGGYKGGDCQREGEREGAFPLTAKWRGGGPVDRAVRLDLVVSGESARSGDIRGGDRADHDGSFGGVDHPGVASVEDRRADGTKGVRDPFVTKVVAARAIRPAAVAS